MVQVTFDYGNEEDKKLVAKMLGGEETKIVLQDPKPEVEKPKPEVEKPKPPAPDTPAPEETVAPEPSGKTITVAEAMPKMAAFFQSSPESVPIAQEKLAALGANHVNELSSEQLVAFLTDLGVEV